MWGRGAFRRRGGVLRDGRRWDLLDGDGEHDVRRQHVQHWGDRLRRGCSVSRLWSEQLQQRGGQRLLRLRAWSAIRRYIERREQVRFLSRREVQLGRDGVLGLRRFERVRG